MRLSPVAPSALLLALLLPLLHCGGGSGSSVSTAGPTVLAATQGSSPFLFNFTWAPPSEAFDGYEFEGRLGTAPYAKLHTGLLPSTWKELSVDLYAAWPELATGGFRMRVMRGTTPSGYSNEVSVRTGLVAPYVYAPYLDGQGIRVSWVCSSLVADTVKLERGITLNGTTAWTTLPGIAFGTTTYADTTYPESSVCSYRVTYSKGQDSTQATSSTLTSPLLAPRITSVTPLLEGVALDWQNPSSAATEVAVMRASGVNSYPSFQQVALLPASTTSYRDTLLATGYYTYRLEHRKSGVATVASASVQVATLPPGATLATAPAILSLPQAAVLRRSSQGAWFLSGGSSYDVRVREPYGSGWTDYVPASYTSWFAPYFLLDSQDRPHMIYTRSVVQGTQEVALMHAWRDATGWQTEEIARRSLYSNSAIGAYTFALDGQDRLHLVWMKGTGGLSDLEYAVRSTSGTWTVEALASMTSTSTYVGNYALAVDAAGEPHLFVGAYQDLFHQTRVGGAWTVEKVPSGGAAVSYYDLLIPTALGTDSLAVLVTKAHEPYDGSYDYLLLRKTAGTWQPAEVAATSPDYPYSYRVALAASPSGSRLALFMGSSGGNKLLFRSGTTWTGGLLGPLTPYSPTLGFDAREKFYALLPVGWGADASAYTYVFYTE